jgi:hypothetical protein
MQSLRAPLTLFNPTPPAPSPAQAFAVSDLVGRIANTLDGDGSWIADDSLDSGGMTIVAGGLLYRVEVSYQGPFDAHAVQERIDRDQMAADDDHPHDAYIGGRDFDDASYQEPEF